MGRPSSPVGAAVHAGDVRGRRTAGRWAFAAVLVASGVVLFTPSSGVPSAPPGTDKVVHVVLFAALALTGRAAGARTAPLVAALAAYAGVSELLQALPALGRSATALDLAADLAGIALGIAAWQGLRSRWDRAATTGRG